VREVGLSNLRGAYLSRSRRFIGFSYAGDEWWEIVTIQSGGKKEGIGEGLGGMFYFRQEKHRRELELGP